MAFPAGAAGRPFAVAPAKRTATPRLPGSSAWRQPEPWTVAFILLTGVVVGFRHPIAKAIGTEVDVDAAVSSSVVAPAAPQPVSSPTHAAVAAAIAAAPTHAPRDPFRSLVNDNAALAPETATGAAAATTPTVTHADRSATQQPTGTRHASGAAGASSCTGTMHTVVSGDTLWSLAARTVKSADTAKVTVAWHRIYRANQPPLSDPSLLPIGTKICLPSSR